jgi:hypothetical protein
MCVEPIPTLFEQLDKNRECVKVQGCAWNQDGVKKFRVIKGYAEMLSVIIENYDSSHIKRIENECESTNGSYEDLDIPCYDINGLLEKNGFFNIDFLSIDTEGSCFEVLLGIDFDVYKFGYISIAYNFVESKRIRIRNLLISKKYKGRPGHNKGKPNPKTALSKIGKPRPDLSERNRLRKGTTKNIPEGYISPLKGVKQSDDLIKKRAESKKKNGKCVLQFDLDGNFIKKYECMTDAYNWMLENNIKGDIKSNLSNRTKKAGGFVWKYE